MTEHTTKRAVKAWVVALAGLAVLLVPATAGASIIGATGTAAQIDQGQYAGWYVYTYSVSWDLSKGLSHLDLILKPGCLQEDHQFAFGADPSGCDGLSTGEHWHTGDPVDYTVQWQGFFEPGGDPSSDITQPLIKWEPGESGDEPGKKGVGVFWFYSNVIPEYVSVGDVIVAKNGQNVTLGDLDGAYPSCHVPEQVPEPLTAGLLGVALAMVAVWRRHR